MSDEDVFFAKDMKIFIIGDSNTYGWDPRDAFGTPYEKPWPYFLKDAGHSVGVFAVPGYEIPHSRGHLEKIKELIYREDPELLLIMLGSNDILNLGMSAGDIALKRMENFVEFILDNTFEDMKLLLMAIPPIAIPGEYPELGRTYNAGLKRLAESKGCLYFETMQTLELQYDGVHLTAKSHEILGRVLSTMIRKVDILEQKWG